MPDLGRGADRALTAAARQPLLDGNSRRNAVHRIDFGPARRLHDAARVGVERFEVTPLPFVEQDVEGQRRLARAADAGDHTELAARNVDRQVLQVVLARVDDLDTVARRREARPALVRVAPVARCPHPRPVSGGKGVRRKRLGHEMTRWAQRQLVIPQRRPGERPLQLAHLLWRAHRNDHPTALAALRPQVDQPVARADHVEVVLDHHQRMSGIEQLAQRTHQARDVVEVQAGRGLVEQEQRALACQRLLAGAAVFRGLGEETGQLESLRFATRQRRHRLAQLDVVQPDIGNRPQHAQHLAVRDKQHGRFGHRQVEHVGHVECATATGCQLVAAFDRHLQNLGPVTLAIAVGATQVHVRQELHLDVLEARTAAGRATPVAAVEAELAGGVAALPRQRRGRKNFA